MSIFKKGPFDVPYELRRIGQNGSATFVCVSPSGLAYDFNTKTASHYTPGNEWTFRALAKPIASHIGEPVEEEPVFQV